MRILLLTDTPPAQNSALGQLLSRLCQFIPPGGLACFIARDGSVQPLLDSALQHVPTCWAFKPGEYGLTSHDGNKAVRAAGMVREYGRRMLRVPNLVSDAVAFGRQQRVDVVWAILHGQTMVRLARPVARALRVPLFTHVPDSFEAWLRDRIVDPLNRRAARREFRACLAESVACATASPAMADEFTKTVGVACVPILPGIDAGAMRPPASHPIQSDELVIGMVGHTYLHEEWTNLVDALARREWLVGGRRVKILTYGSPPPPTPGPRGRVEHRHFSPQLEVIDALAAEADVLYCPHPFNASLVEFARLGFPAKLATYFAAGKPVIFHGPVYSSAYELLKSNGAAVCVPGADQDSIFSALEQVSLDRQLYLRTAQAGVALARERFTVDRMRADFSSFLTGQKDADLGSARVPARVRDDKWRVREDMASKIAPNSQPPLPATQSASSSDQRRSADDVVRYVLSADLKRAEALNSDLAAALAEAKQNEQALLAEVIDMRSLLASQGMTMEGTTWGESSNDSTQIQAQNLEIEKLRGELQDSLILRYAKSADIQRAQAFNAELQEQAQAIRAEKEQVEAALATKGEQLDKSLADVAELLELLGGVSDARRAEREQVEAALATKGEQLDKSLADVAELSELLVGVSDARRAEREQFEADLAMKSRQLEASVARIEGLSAALSEALQERSKLHHAVELGEVRSAATVDYLNREIAHIRQEADRAFAERADGLAEVAHLRERMDVLQRELAETRIELAVQNVRLALTGEVVELRTKMSSASAVAQAETSLARVAEAERETSVARDMLTALQQAHVSEVRAGIEFITNQIAEAKEVKDAEARMAGRLSMLASELGAVRRNLGAATTGDSSQASFLRGLYLDLLEASLTGLTSGDPNMDRWGSHKFDADRRLLGRDWPRTAQTMIGVARLRNIRTLAELIIEDRVEGDFLEAGVWRGGACIYMRGIMLAHADKARSVWVADSFQGLPLPEPARYPADAADQHHEYDELQVTVDQVRENFEAYGLLDGNVKFLVGWFKDTLPAAPIEKLALLRLDGDMYSSTMETLEALYHKVSPGGFIIVDDYILKPCRQAITDFRERLGIHDPIQEVDGAAVYWRKSAPAEVRSERKPAANNAPKKRPGKADVAAE